MAIPNSKSETQKIGMNVDVEVTDTQIIVRIDRTKTYGSSASGKTIIVASSQGNKQITADGIVLGLNAYRYPDR